MAFVQGRRERQDAGREAQGTQGQRVATRTNCPGMGPSLAIIRRAYTLTCSLTLYPEYAVAIAYRQSRGQQTKEFARVDQPRLSSPQLAQMRTRLYLLIDIVDLLVFMMRF